MSRIIAAALCALAFQLGAGQAAAVGFGALGDSLTDEYLADNPNPTHTDLPAFTWLQLLAELRGVDFGAFSAETREEPRNAGYEHNWARAGGTAGPAPFFIAAGGLSTQTFGNSLNTGLLPAVASGAVEIVFIGAGHNDYFYRDYIASSPFEQEVGNDPELFILDDPGLEAFEQVVLDGIMNSVNAILQANENAKVVVAKLPPDTLLSVDYIVAAMAQFNGRLETAIEDLGSERVKLTDIYDWQEKRYDGDNLLFGGYEIPRDSKASEDDLTPPDTDVAGQEPCDSMGRCATLEYALNLVCHDEVPGYEGEGGHPGTIMQGLIANRILEAVNPWLDTPIEPFSDEEILEAAVVPEPGSTLLAGSALVALAALRGVGGRRRRYRKPSRTL